MKNIKFSICIPNYNYGKYIGYTIKSVLSQNYEDFEIIVSDNNSTDNSIEIIKSFTDHRIKLIRNKYNIGFIGNLNKVTENASGDFIILLSSDDIMKQNALKSYEDIIIKNKENLYNIFLMSRCEIIDTGGDIIGHKGLLTGDLVKFSKSHDINQDYYEYNGHQLLRELFLNRFQTPGQFPSMCYSKKLYEKVEGFSGHMSIFPDAYFSHKILFENPKVIYVNDFLFQYREHDSNNLASINRFDNIKSLIDPYYTTIYFKDKLLDKLSLKNKDLKRSFVNNICLKKSMFCLLRGQLIKGLRIIMFSISAYPKITVFNSLFIFNIFLIFLNPLIFIAFMIYKLINRKY